ncbi:HNH endonuclease [Acidovorax sp. LjRoot74]|uniref:HNH endonuclease n=1 Tax=Acidovorax sp. LjRoot74 TaxID=3342337 RepID=UPI003F4FC231
MSRNSLEKYPGQRNKEKRELFGRYQLRVIENLYKRRFFEHFDNRCFKCGMPEKVKQEVGSPPNLCMDHHLSMALGGHLTPGNLVSLCRKCNGLKLDRAPADFYTQEELARLQPLLDAQNYLFAFSFDRDQWTRDRETYLLAVGVDQDVVHAALNDEDFVGYVGKEEKQIGITITITIDDALLPQILENRQK